MANLYKMLCIYDKPHVQDQYIFSEGLNVLINWLQEFYVENMKSMEMDNMARIAG